MTNSPAFDRRKLLLGSTGAAALAALGGTAVWGAASASADEAKGGYFKLSVPAERGFRQQPLHNNTVLQSFCFDNDNGDTYTLQIMEGGLQLPGEDAPVPWKERSDRGDLCLSRLDGDANVTGHMYLKGFGHGIACGADPDGSDVYLWTETDSNPDSGYGRGICRFKFVDEQVLEYGVDDFETHHPQPGSTSNQPSVDVLNRRLLLRYSDPDSTADDPTRYALYDLDALSGGEYEPIYDVARVGIEEGEWFQGFTVFGDYVYQLTGRPYTDENGDNPPSGRGDCHMSSIDLRTGELVERFRTEAGYSLNYREPEGLAVRLTEPRRLYLGFACDPGPRTAALYYKPQAES